MRFRALAVAMLFPLGLLAACGGGDDAGLQTRGDNDEQSDDTDDESTDTTEASTDDTEESTDDTEESTDTTEESTDDTEEPADTTEASTDDTEESTDDTSGGTDIDTTEITNPDGTLKDEYRDAAIQGLTAQGFTEEQAGCLIDEMVEILGVETLIDIGLTGGGDPAAALDALTPEQTTQIVDAFFTCDIDPTQLG